MSITTTPPPNASQVPVTGATVMPTALPVAITVAYFFSSSTGTAEAGDKPLIMQSFQFKERKVYDV